VDADAQLGNKTIRPFVFTAQAYRSYFQGTDAQLKVAFATPTNFASVHVIATEGAAIGRLDAYDSNGQILVRDQSVSLAPNASAWLEVQSDARIAYVVAYGHQDTKIKIDQIRYGLPGEVTTDAQGAFQFPVVAGGNYSLRSVPPAGFANQFPADGIANIAMSGSGVRSDLAVFKELSPWQNPTQRQDVNNDGFVSLFDVLVIINEINRNGARQLSTADASAPPFIDVDGNRIVEALDVLIVINAINSGLASGEGEGSEGVAPESLQALDQAMSQGDAFWWDEVDGTGRRRRS
jgi:hypothetical protein